MNHIKTALLIIGAVVAVFAAYTEGYQRGQRAQDQVWCEGIKDAGLSLRVCKEPTQ